jgi:hypothetical protein
LIGGAIISTASGDTFVQVLPAISARGHSVCIAPSSSSAASSLMQPNKALQLTSHSALDRHLQSLASNLGFGRVAAALRL